ncbi:MAG TPA: NrfD/PsrC family molybdoenzyme membrane anchor subunit [Candidatus Sulfotelmatobacter sp.]|nr:NrfD/PsrC family molybdoenzyme membrane anchor subunit [Candidatus Sulfotelmatobacter sp.]
MSDSYYGKPIVRPHIWGWYIDVYFWLGGLAGAGAVAMACARMRGAHKLANAEKRAALAAIALAGPLLIVDLGRPARFYNMLRVFKPTSPMSVGTWIFSAYGAALGGSTLAELLGWRRTQYAGEALAGLVGPALATYTAALVADTATPAWHEAHDVLPFLFASSAVAAAGSAGVAFAPLAESGSARRLMIGGALAMVGVGGIMETRLGPLLAEPYHTGRAGALQRATNTLALTGAVLGLLGRRSRTVSTIAAACVAAAGMCERFTVLAAGKQSALDPKYTVEPQRARMAAREKAQPPAA